MEKYVFPKDFVWGTATASYQVEGAVREDGRGECIWDTFSRKPGAVYAGENGDVACDQYHRYAEDAALMAELGFNSYRFSIAWPRIIPAGTGKVNPEGIAYYRRLCDELHKYNIKTCATLYHWDLPQILEEKGGWTNRSVIDAFREYVKVCYGVLGDVIDMWCTINEPYCVAYLGHLMGVHAPGHRDLQKAMAAVHHVNLAHGIAVEEYRKTKLKAPIGIVWNPVTPRPAANSEADIKAAKFLRSFSTEVFIYPALGKGYPEEIIKDKKYNIPVEEGDLETIAQPIDFIGINYYFENAVTADESAPNKAAFKPSWHDTTAMGWPVIPAGFERQLDWIYEISKGAFGKEEIPIYITENGCAYDDELTADGRIHDRQRVEYLKQHLAVCANAIKKGIPLKGYFVWSLMDNFEWAYGYAKRFGIIHVDFKTQKRTFKDSAFFFRDVIAGFADW
uniref:Beta-glucosidase n=1 Tax=uncultured bacterium contig00207 TaxID=1181610 RepID=A0A806JZZ2_9BACT|nr:beta-glucosidase [uncultured bacterium contig00207]